MTTTRAVLLSLALLTVGLAGCMGGGNGDDAGSTASPSSTNTTFDDTNDTTETDVAEDTGPEVNVSWYNGSVQGASTPLLGPYCYPCGDHVWEVQIPNGTAAIIAEAFWNASNELQFDLDVPPEPCEVSFPTDNDCQPDQKTGSSPLEYRITREMMLHAGNWSVEIWPQNNPAEPVEFTVVVSVFTGDEVPNQWSKVPD